LRLDSGLSPEAVTFQTSKDASEYTLRIKGIVQQSDREIVEEIAKKHSLAVKQESDGVILFKPFPPTWLLAAYFEGFTTTYRTYTLLSKRNDSTVSLWVWQGFFRS
jgi:hypothetical protein